MWTVFIVVVAVAVVTVLVVSRYVDLKKTIDRETYNNTALQEIRRLSHAPPLPRTCFN